MIRAGSSSRGAGAGLALALALVVATTAAAARAERITVVFHGSYTLDSHAEQTSFDPSSTDCIPGSRQRESERAAWTVTFVGTRTGGGAVMRLRQDRAAVSGTHVWDERSFRCVAFPPGQLVCRSRLAAGRSALTIELSHGRWTFHPALALVAVGGGCSGRVFNEHPDCGARDAAAVSDFAFLTSLRTEAPRLQPPRRIASFDVRRSRACREPGTRAQPGSRNPNDIRQRTTVRYRGTLALVP
jgi:hypothetical protein